VRRIRRGKPGQWREGFRDAAGRKEKGGGGETSEAAGRETRDEDSEERD